EDEIAFGYEETVDPLSVEEIVDPLSLEEIINTSTVEGMLTSSSVTAQSSKKDPQIQASPLYNVQGLDTEEGIFTLDPVDNAEGGIEVKLQPSDAEDHYIDETENWSWVLPGITHETVPMLQNKPNKEAPSFDIRTVNESLFKKCISLENSDVKLEEAFGNKNGFSVSQKKASLGKLTDKLGDDGDNHGYDDNNSDDNNDDDDKDDNDDVRLAELPWWNKMRKNKDLKPQKMYKDMILEAIASSTNSKGVSWISICKYICETFAIGCVIEDLFASHTRTVIKKLLSAGDIIKIRSKYKLASTLSEADKDANKSKEKYTETHFTERENYENKADENYKQVSTDMVHSKEREIYKEEEEKIFDEDNYVECPIEGCWLIVFGKHIEVHLRDHESSNLKISRSQCEKRFICTECGYKCKSFREIANHIFSHFNEKAKEHKDRVCNKCGYKTNILNNFKTHQCNLKIMEGVSSDDMLSKENPVNTELETTKKNDETAKKESCQNIQLGNPKKIIDIDKPPDESHYSPSDSDMECNASDDDMEYNPPDDSEYSVSDSDMEDSDSEIKNIKVGCRKNRVKVKVADQETSMQLHLCDDCGKTYYNKSSLRAHKRLHLETKINCSKCNYVAPTNRHLIEHTKRIHMERVKVMCKKCNKTYMSKASLYAHVRVSHSSLIKNVNTFPCDTCDKVFSTKHRLNTHMLIHTGVKPFACELCKFSTVQKHNLTVHMRSHERGTIKSETTVITYDEKGR
ncbi:unnamed protein product, partial [Meganyctiphanes norvegica]